MHCLAGTFVQEIPSEVCADTKMTFYPVKIVLPPNKSRILYFDKLELQREWKEKLKKAMGYANVFDFYECGQTLGKGQFGLVRLATHKRTKAQVAIKVVKKANMKNIEVYQMRREIEVLKMCQHKSIIKLVDVFENSDYYYVVLEYLAGKDMFEYIQKRNFSLPEERVKQLMFQLMQAVKYLNAFGIVHRDLKLENVMMSDATDRARPIIVDFGLAKIIGPNQTATEPFGTLGYAAPEVLKKSPYSFSCDVWSLGCIAYALLSGSLPFDHDSQKETIRMTMENPLVFDLSCWKKISDECKMLLTEMLVKNPANRINLNQAT
jgi:serine/threonine protein kinase